MQRSKLVMGGADAGAGGMSNAPISLICNTADTLSGVASMRNYVWTAMHAQVVMTPQNDQKNSDGGDQGGNQGFLNVAVERCTRTPGSCSSCLGAHNERLDEEKAEHGLVHKREEKWQR